MDAHVVFEDYGIPLTDLSSVTSGCFSTVSELAGLDELAQLMTRPAAVRADAVVVASALDALRPELVAPVLSTISKNTSPDIANLVIDSIEDPGVAKLVMGDHISAVARPPAAPASPATPADSSGSPRSVIVTAARAIVEVVDDIAELVSIAIKTKKAPALQRALIDTAPAIAGLLPEDTFAADDDEAKPAA
jgi:hypothetical protein